MMIFTVALSPDGKILAAGGFGDEAVELWDVATGKKLARLTGHKGPVLSMRFSRDAAILASLSADCTVLLWDLKSIDR